MKKTLLITLLIMLCVVAPISADNTLADIKTAGVLNFGTASDYIPFIYHNENDELDGLDVALVKEIAKRMGVDVKIYDMAFDGLLDAVEIGQVDMAGGALSKTDERANQVDFTRIYYPGAGILLANSTVAIPETFSLEALRNARVGVQRGTTFEAWVTTNLVSAGFISTQNMFRYSKVNEVVSALEKGDVDFVLIDKDVYTGKYQSAGKFKPFGSDLVQENYAYAAKKGSDLIAEVNKHLNDMMADGTAQSIADKYFAIDFSNLEQQAIVRPNQIVTPVPVIVPTSAPVPASCINGMAFVQDVTITDGHQVHGGETFTKIWRIKNTGTCAWGTNYSFVYVSGDQMNGQTSYISTNVQPGQTYDMAVPLRAPGWNGTFRGIWQMRSPTGQNFGQSIWVKIRVNDGPAPVPTAVPPMPGPIYPTQAPKPVEPTEIPVVFPTINQWEPDYYAGEIGECPTVYWSVNNAASVDISVNGQFVARYTDSAGYASGLCNWNGSGTYSFELMASNVWDSAYSQFTYTVWDPVIYDDEVFDEEGYDDGGSDEFFFDDGFEG